MSESEAGAWVGLGGPVLLAGLPGADLPDLALAVVVGAAAVAGALALLTWGGCGRAAPFRFLLHLGFFFEETSVFAGSVKARVPAPVFLASLRNVGQDLWLAGWRPPQFAQVGVSSRGRGHLPAKWGSPQRTQAGAGGNCGWSA